MKCRVPCAGMQKRHSATKNRLQGFQRLASRLHLPFFALKIACQQHMQGRHRIYYRIDNTRIYVLRILHDRMGAVRHLPDN